MAKLKLSAIENDKPVKVTHDLPASLHRDLVTYAEIPSRENGQSVSDPVKLMAPMLAAVHGNGSSFCEGPPRSSISR